MKNYSMMRFSRLMMGIMCLMLLLSLALTLPSCGDDDDSTPDDPKKETEQVKQPEQEKEQGQEQGKENGQSQDNGQDQKKEEDKPASETIEDNLPEKARAFVGFWRNRADNLTTASDFVFFADGTCQRWLSNSMEYQEDGYWTYNEETQILATTVGFQWQVTLSNAESWAGLSLTTTSTSTNSTFEKCNAGLLAAYLHKCNTKWICPEELNDILTFKLNGGMYSHYVLTSDYYNSVSLKEFDIDADNYVIEKNKITVKAYTKSNAEVQFVFENYSSADATLIVKYRNTERKYIVYDPNVDYSKNIRTIYVYFETSDGKSLSGYGVKMYSTGNMSEQIASQTTNKNGNVTFVIGTNPKYGDSFVFKVTYKSKTYQSETVTITGGETKAASIIVPAEEKISFSNVVVKAQRSEQVIIDGEITANTVIKKLVLSADEKGQEVIADLLVVGDKEKSRAIEEAGKKYKTFTLDIPTVTVDFQVMYLVGETEQGKQVSEQIAQSLWYSIGARNSDWGSYLSIVNNKQMTIDNAKRESTEVIAESSDDGYTVTGLYRASQAKNADVAARAGKVAFYQNGTSVNKITVGGVIVTASGVICKVVDIKNTSSGDATIVGVTVKKSSYGVVTVDVSAVQSDFSK